jgi:hypothetical protein
MRERILTAYYCDHCNRMLLTKRAMKKHEPHCALNPQRVCMLCEPNTQDSVKAAIAMLPEIPGADRECSCNTLIKEIEEIMPAMLDRLEHCPSCMLAAMMQSGAYKLKFYDYKQGLSQWHKIQYEEFTRVVGIPHFE